MNNLKASLNQERGEKWPVVLVTTTSITLPTADEGTSPKNTKLVYIHTHPTQQQELRTMVNQNLR